MSSSASSPEPAKQWTVQWVQLQEGSPPVRGGWAALGRALRGRAGEFVDFVSEASGSQFVLFDAEVQSGSGVGFEVEFGPSRDTRDEAVLFEQWLVEAQRPFNEAIRRGETDLTQGKVLIRTKAVKEKTDRKKALLSLLPLQPLEIGALRWKTGIERWSRRTFRLRWLSPWARPGDADVSLCGVPAPSDATPLSPVSPLLDLGLEDAVLAQVLAQGSRRSASFGVSRELLPARAFWTADAVMAGLRLAVMGQSSRSARRAVETVFAGGSLVGAGTPPVALTTASARDPVIRHALFAIMVAARCSPSFMLSLCTEVVTEAPRSKARAKRGRRARFEEEEGEEGEGKEEGEEDEEGFEWQSARGAEEDSVAPGFRWEPSPPLAHALSDPVCLASIFAANFVSGKRLRSKEMAQFKKIAAELEAPDIRMFNRLVQEAAVSSPDKEQEERGGKDDREAAAAEGDDEREDVEEEGHEEEDEEVVKEEEEDSEEGEEDGEEGEEDDEDGEEDDEEEGEDEDKDDDTGASLSLGFDGWDLQS